MTRKDAIEAIKCNWPDSRYTILREALDMAVKALEDVTDKNVGKMTNADRIRAMRDEELAEEIGRSSIPELCDIVCGVDCKAAATFNTTLEKRCADFVLDWLQRPAEEADND